MIGDKRTVINHLFLFLAFSGSLLVLVPFYPSFPAATLDLSWAYALNEAVRKHLIFGKDVIFTFGPLSSVYTDLYHPETYLVILGSSCLIAAAFVVGCFVLCDGSYLILLLPFILSQCGLSETGLYDSVYFVMPFLIQLATTRLIVSGAKLTVFSLVLILFMFSGLALLPLIKISFSVPVFVCGSLTTITIARKSIAAAIVAGITAALAMALAWCLMGQPLSELPGYFFSQQPVILGYGEAMSVSGAVSEPITYLLGALVVWAAFILAANSRFGKQTIGLALGLAIVLFLGFKEGFVRHDHIHPLAAGGTLLLSSFVLLLTFRFRFFAVGMVAGICGWAAVNGAYVDVNPAGAFSRFTRVLSRSMEGLFIQVSSSISFPKVFEDMRAQIRKELPLPEASGTVDLYPFNLAAIFAAGQEWSPRPVIQSYSAYAPNLATLNRIHLEGDSAPDRIYFAVSTLDHRYPSLDDGASWPVLISRYQATQYTRGPDGWFGLVEYAILEKRFRPIAVHVGPPLMNKRASLGDEVSVPRANAPIWANIDVEPTFIGRVLAVIYKLPPLFLELRYADGSTEQFRFIPAEAHTGFLLTPTVRNATDFTHLLGGQQDEIGRDRPCASFAISAGSNSVLKRIIHYLWIREYSVVLAELQF
jgi:hypothetical protein